MDTPPQTPTAGEDGPDAGRRALEALFAQEKTRRGMAEILEETIAKAHDINPACWGVTLEAEAPRLHLHVGRVIALAAEEGEITVIFYDDGLTAPTHLEDSGDEVTGTFKSLHEIAWHRFGVPELLEQWPEVRGAHLDAVERAAKQVRRTPYMASHSPGLLAALGEILARSPPAPEHSVIEPGSGAEPGERLWKGLAGSRQREFRSLLGEFLDELSAGAAGVRKLELRREARRVGRRNFEDLLEAAERGGKIGEEVLRRLLPHAESAENRRRGAWVVAGGGLSGEVMGWLAAQGGPGPEQATRIAAALLDFVRCSVEDPESLPDVCRGFTALPYTRGFHAGLVTPILNTVRPEEFLALDDRTRQAINHFAGTTFDRGLGDYPAANTVGRKLLERLADELSIAQDFGLLPCDLFAAFSHWMEGSHPEVSEPTHPALPGQEGPPAEGVPKGAVPEALPASEAAGGESRPPAVSAPNPPYPLQRLAAETHLDPAILEGWARTVRRKGQAVFYGPPGTGKTYLAGALARHLAGGADGLVELLPLHAGYTYESFLQAPGVAGEAPRPGRFLDLCRRAEERSGTSVLILDDIHRTDLARLLGEAVVLLERRGEEVPLAGGGRFAVPPNLLLLGTLSSAASGPFDDPVLARRFAWLHLPPRWEVLRRRHEGGPLPVEGLISVLERLNRAIEDPRREIGPAPFLGEDLAGTIADVWRTEIEPLLEQLFIADPETLESFRWARIEDEVLS